MEMSFLVSMAANLSLVLLALSCIRGSLQVPQDPSSGRDHDNGTASWGIFPKEASAMTTMETYKELEGKNITKVSLPRLKCTVSWDCLHDWAEPHLICVDGHCTCSDPYCWNYRYISAGFDSKYVFACGKCGVLGSSCNGSLPCEFPGECRNDHFCHCPEGENYGGICLVTNVSFVIKLAFIGLGLLFMVAVGVGLFNAWRHPNRGLGRLPCFTRRPMRDRQPPGGSGEKSPAYTIESSYYNFPSTVSFPSSSNSSISSSSSTLSSTSTATTESGGETLVAGGHSSRSMSTASLDAMLSHTPPDTPETACRMFPDTSYSFLSSDPRAVVIDNPSSTVNNHSLLTGDPFKEALNDPLSTILMSRNSGHAFFGEDQSMVSLPKLGSASPTFFGDDESIALAPNSGSSIPVISDDCQPETGNPKQEWLFPDEGEKDIKPVHQQSPWTNALSTAEPKLCTDGPRAKQGWTLIGSEREHRDAKFSIRVTNL